MHFRNEALTNKAYYEAVESGIDFTEETWMEQFENVVTTLSKIEPMSSEKLSSWATS